MAMELLDGEPLAEVMANGQAAAGARRGGHGHPARPRARLRACARHRAPRHQARQHHAAARHADGQGHRLRHRPRGDRRRASSARASATCSARRSTCRPSRPHGEKLDGRSDLFSAGIVLYQMLTGQRPFEGDSLVALAMKIAKEEPAPIAKLRPDVPAALRRVVERCLAKAPDRRFQTGKELSDALSRVLAEIDAAALRAGQAAHRAAAREVGGDDGADRRRGDGGDRHRDHPAPVRGADGSGDRLRRRAGAFHRRAERGVGACSTSGRRSTCRCRRS